MLNCQAPGLLILNFPHTVHEEARYLGERNLTHLHRFDPWIGWMVAFFHVVISGMHPENDKYDIGVFGFKSHRLQPTNAITMCWLFEVVFDCEFLLHRR